ncbi:acyltransferase [Agrobacterium tumefaciens]|uniref:acyltransferase n=1 Tax=Agrobacterium tumefaciens TaxID=358 RepID=UPI00157282B3|nr:hypothetical protein [Agrobacterium tumefaciens]NTA45146.1 hypothetical protein [Agrobacterium tumefaciens]WIE33975.1 hypothetical protein G6L82_014090 [Agrobacterium tumefaciens]
MQPVTITPNIRTVSNTSSCRRAIPVDGRRVVFHIPRPALESYRRHILSIRDEGNNNSILVGSNIEHDINVRGDGNLIEVGESKSPSRIKITINGNNNRIRIERPIKIGGLRVSIGNHVAAHNATLDIGGGMSCEHDCDFFIYNSGNRVVIGEDCMLSREIILRSGESPHLIFDSETKEYLDVSDGVFIGNHVWIGERAYITKRASISNNSVVAACSVVTKRFEEEGVVVAGNPAKITRRGVIWFRNYSFLPEGSDIRDKWLVARRIAENKNKEPT